MEFCQDAQFKLEAIPSSTVEYVESLTFLDDIQEKVSNKEDLIFIVTWVFIKEIFYSFSATHYTMAQETTGTTLYVLSPQQGKREWQRQRQCRFRLWDL